MQMPDDVAIAIAGNELMMITKDPFTLSPKINSEIGTTPPVGRSAT
jgi:hypothetical protein